MTRITILLLIFLGECAFSWGYGLTEDQVYISSLAANIEKSGLLTNFDQSWRQHLQMWQQARQSDADWTNNSTAWPTNTTWPTTWPSNGTWPTPAVFSCNTTAPTEESEHSINRLHPSHIDIVAAMGASIVAGTGAEASRLLEITLQFRGVSFPIGGDGTLNDTITVPNILKEYNPRVRGWSRNIAPAWFEEMAELNVAVPGAVAADLEDQAKELVKRINQRPLARDKWKLITIYIGLNDLCEACDRRFGGRASSYGRRIKNALDKLEKGLTRTVVNVVAVPPIHQWYRQLNDYPVCWALHRYLCPCISNSDSDNIAGQYNAELEKLPARYTRSDFAVVVQPFMSGFLQLPKVNVDGSQKADISYFAPDCFHLSRKGHAAAARSLWKNLFEAVGEKSNTLILSDDEISCPDQDCPFIRTSRNTNECTTSRSTAHSRLDNLSSQWWDWVRNHSLPHTTHHWNFSENTTTEFSIPVLTLKPWQRNFIRLAQIPSEAISSTYSSASGAWIAFGVILAAAVVATATIGLVDLKKRRARRGNGERTPLLTGSNLDAEQIY